MFKRIQLITSCLLLLCAGTVTLAQDIRVKASVNRDRILIGEPILLQLEAELPEGMEMKWFRLDTIAHFEYIDRSPLDTAKGVSGIIYSQVLTITSFDSGSQVIPRMPLTVNNNRYLTDSINIEVGYTAADPRQPYHDIKDIIDVPAVDNLYINYIIALVTILAIVALVWFLRKKKPVKEVVGARLPELSPFDKAMQALAGISRGALSTPGEVKQYHIRLNAILRDYLRARGVLRSPDSSNEQLVVSAKKVMDTEQLYQLAQSLRLTDAVKFAKYQPGPEENEKVYEDIAATIRAVEEDFLQRQALQRQEQARLEQMKQTQKSAH